MNNDFELYKGRIIDVGYSIDSFTERQGYIQDDVCYSIDDRQCYIQDLDIKLEDRDDELIQLKLKQTYFEKGLLIEGDEVYLLYHDGFVIDIRKV